MFESIFYFVANSIILKMLVLVFYLSFAIKPLVERGYLSKWGFAIPLLTCLSVGCLYLVF